MLKKLLPFLILLMAWVAVAAPTPTPTVQWLSVQSLINAIQAQLNSLQNSINTSLPTIPATQNGQIIVSNVTNGPSWGLSSGPTITQLPPIQSQVSISGGVLNGGTSSDQISGVCINGVCPVTTFGAANNDANTSCTGNIAASTTSLSLSSCSPLNDFKNNGYVLIPAAGPNNLATVATPSVAVVGSTASSTWTYVVAYYDRWGGLTAKSTAATTSTGPSTATSLNYVRVTLGAGSYTYCDAGVYRTVAPAGVPTGFIGVINGCNGGSLGDTNLPVVPSGAFPASAPTSAVPQYLVAKIVSGGGTGSVTIGTAASNTATNVTVVHDETQAFQACVNNATSIGGKCYVPAGTYNLDQLSWWQSGTTSWIYANPINTATQANEMFGLVHLSSNTIIAGDIYAASVLRAPYVVANSGFLLASANPTSTSIPGAVCNTGVETGLTKKAINNVTRGSTFVTTTTATDAGTFNPGDLVLVGGGVNSGNVACSNSFPRVEANIVKSVDSGTGNVYLQYGLLTDFPYGTAGTSSFIAQINPYYFQNITVSDLTFDSTSGSSALSIQSTIRAQILRNKFTSESWGPKLNFAGSRDVLFQDDQLFTTSGEEMDQNNDITWNRNILTQQGGQAQLSFDEGGSGITFTNNKIASNDYLTGINNRGGGPIALQVTCANDVAIENNNFSQNTTAAPGIIIDQPNSCNATGQPLPFNWRISHNHIKANSVSSLSAITESIPLANQEISDNDIYINAGASTSYGVSVLGALVENNVITDVNGHTFAIHVANSSANTTPETIVNNVVNAGGDSCIQINNTASQPLAVRRNTCVSSTSPLQVLQTINGTNYPSTYLDIQDATAAYSPTTLSFALGCTHGILPPTSAGSGTLTTGSTDCYFEVTGTTVFTDTVTFQKAFAKIPVCNCSDETTQAALSCLPSTTTAIVGGGTSNDGFNCKVSGY